MADISVLNTDSDLSAQTLLTAEGSHTVTGAQTFDRDPLAPFVVTSGSALVTNLDADKLDGSEGLSYVHKTNDCIVTSYTPSITNGTLGNGTIAGQYTQLGKLVFFAINFNLGATSTVGSNIIFSLAVTALDQAMMPTLVQGYAFDTSASAFYPLVAVASGSGTTVFPANSASPLAGLSATSPFTWATGDALRITGFYYAL